MRPLSALRVRCRDDEKPRTECLPVQRVVEPGAAAWGGGGERARTRVLRAPGRCPVAGRHRADAHAVPLGPAGSAGRPWRLAEPGCCALVRRLCTASVPAPG